MVSAGCHIHQRKRLAVGALIQTNSMEDDGGVDIVPDDFIGLVAEDSSEEGYETLNVEIARVDRRVQLQQITK